jgi:hypothetical protein
MACKNAAIEDGTTMSKAVETACREWLARRALKKGKRAGG